jgi:hypothetical protein
LGQKKSFQKEPTRPVMEKKKGKPQPTLMEPHYINKVDHVDDTEHMDVDENRVMYFDHDFLP